MHSHYYILNHTTYEREYIISLNVYDVTVSNHPLYSQTTLLSPLLRTFNFNYVTYLRTVIYDAVSNPSLIYTARGE